LSDFKISLAALKSRLKQTLIQHFVHFQLLFEKLTVRCFDLRHNHGLADPRRPSSLTITSTSALQDTEEFVATLPDPKLVVFKTIETGQDKVVLGYEPQVGVVAKEVMVYSHGVFTSICLAEMP
jgi:hypothetical protein